MSGTPVITSDWGSFPEIVQHGITGFRCKTIKDFEIAAKQINKINPNDCRKWAMNFSTHNIANMYDDYFQNIIGNKIKNTTNKFEIMPIENDSEYSINTNWYKTNKKPGISFILRAKNEEKTIKLAMESLSILDFPYEINVVLNQCTDNTESIVKECQNSGLPINIYYYPFTLGKTGLENMATPVNSVHSTIWLLNWIMTKGKYQYSFRWDADFIMTSSLKYELKNIVESKIDKAFKITTIFSKSGHKNSEFYFFSNNLNPQYMRYCLWHELKFGVRTFWKEPKIHSFWLERLNSSFIHDSDLNEWKEHWNQDPWWEEENPTNEICEKIKNQFNKLKEQFPQFNVLARGACDEANELAKAILKQIKDPTSEILELSAFIKQYED